MQNYLIWVPVVVGAAVAICGAFAMLRGRSDMSVVASLFVGLLFASVPIITKASFNKDGATFETIATASDKLSQSVAASTEAIEKVQSSLSNLEVRVSSVESKTAGQTAGAGPQSGLVVPESDLSRLKAQFDQDLLGLGETIGRSKGLNSAVASDLRTLQMQ